MSKPASRIPALDGLRGIAILMVLVMHCYVIVDAPENALHGLIKSVCSIFFVGVDLFFVLSGFFIGGILIDQRDSPHLLRGFFARRFFRIAPAYALLLASFWIFREFSTLASLSSGRFFASPVPLFCWMRNVS